MRLRHQTTFRELDGWSWYTLTLTFALQTSTALTSVLASGTLIWAIIHPQDCVATWRKLRTEPVFLAMLFLSGAILLGVPVALLNGYSPWEMLGKHIPFLFFFLILGLLQKPERRWAAFIGFGLGALLALSTSLFSAASGIPIHNVDLATADYNTFRNHTEHNIFLGLPTFALAIALLRSSHRSLINSLGWLLVSLAIFDILHLVHGRTGQLVFIPLLIFTVVETLKRRHLIIGAVVCGVGILSVLPGIPGPPSAIQLGIQSARQDIASYQLGHTETSVGYRIDFFDTTLQLIRERPILGFGTGGFVPAYAEYIKTHNPSQEASHNPHNDYLFYWAENGLIGFLAIVLLYFNLAVTAWHLGGLRGSWLGALTFSWAIPSLANSVLLDHASSFVFTTMLATLIAGPLPIRTIHGENTGN
jgi:hypothetical protein